MMTKPKELSLDERIDTALHPERNGVKMRGVAEGASHEHIVKADLKALIRSEVAEIIGPDELHDKWCSLRIAENAGCDCGASNRDDLREHQRTIAERRLT